MNFIEAVRLAEKGKKIKRMDWTNNDYLIALNFTLVWGTILGNPPYNDILESFLANDWEIYEEKPKTVDFQEALKTLNTNKSIKRIGQKKWLNYNFMSEVDKLFSYEDIHAKDWIIRDSASEI